MTKSFTYELSKPPEPLLILAIEQSSPEWRHLAIRLSSYIDSSLVCIARHPQ
ncbi:hypothetical protein PanWU01x14_322830, partial [Parasponia andersonii]